MTRALVIAAVIVALVGSGLFYAATVMSDNAFNDLLTLVENSESTEVWEERFAYLGSSCDLYEGVADIPPTPRTDIAHRMVRDLDPALTEHLLVAIAEFERLSIPPWSPDIDAARDAVIAHEQVWVELLEREMELASQIEGESDLDARFETIDRMFELDELAEPEINATFETARRRFSEAAGTTDEEKRVDRAFEPTRVDCTRYELVADRWGE